MTSYRLKKGGKGLAVTCLGDILGFFAAYSLLGGADIDQASYNAGIGCFFAMLLTGVAVYLIWFGIRSGRLDAEVNPGLVEDYHTEALIAAGLLMAAIFIFTAILRIGSIEDIAALTVSALLTAAISLGSLYGGLRAGTSDL